MPVVCVLYDVLKNIKLPVWNDFQFCSSARQADSKKKLISFFSVHVWLGQIQSQGTEKRQTCHPIHFPIRVQNITFNLNKLFLDHKLMFVDPQTKTGGRTWTNCLTPLSLYVYGGKNHVFTLSVRLTCSPKPPLTYF